MEPSEAALLLPSCFFALYLILEAADWGLCLAAPLVTRSREENRAVLSLLRPCLDGNELWFFMGFFMLSAGLPDMQDSGMHFWYMAMLVLVGVSAVFRMAVVLVRRSFDSALMMKCLSAFAVAALFLMGLLGAYVLMDEGSLFTVTGVFCAVWTVLACFQIGSLYGAVKVVNPLGERFRAAFLVSSCLSAVFYVVFAVSLRMELGDAWEAGGYFWLSLLAATVLFFASFFLTRSRHPAPGLAAAYASSFFAIAIYFSAYVMVVPAVHTVDIAAMKAGMDAVPGTAFLVIAAVWSLGAFCWRLFRKKVEYTWEDHI